MDIVHEQSSNFQGRGVVAYLALLCIGGFMAFEGYNSFFLHKISVAGWIYDFFLLVLWIWRCMFTYTYTLQDNNFHVEKKGLGMNNELNVDLGEVIAFDPTYKRSIFPNRKLKWYQNWYSSSDGNNQRLLVYKHQEQTKGLLFKSSDRFVKELTQRLPKECHEGKI